jgi:hypothetical protein
MFFILSMLKRRKTMDNIDGTYSTNLYNIVSTAIQQFLHKQLDSHFASSLWTHGNLTPGSGAVFNSYPEHYAPKAGFAAQHLPRQHAVQFSDLEGHKVVISEYYCFINDEPVSREEARPYVEEFVHNLREEAKMYSSTEEV